MIKQLLPLLLVIILAPALSFAVAQFVLLPKLKAQLEAAVAAAPAATAAGHEAPGHEAPADAKGDKSAAHGKKGEPTTVGNSYEFTNVVVNLAGTMGTRYLKASFVVTGTDATLRSQFESNKAKMTDVSLLVLSSLTLADLEEAGAKNFIREKLITAYNRALGSRLVEQVYFSDFVVQ